MADKVDIQIGEHHRRIAGTNRGRRFPVMSGKVMAGSYDEDDNTVSVQLTADADDTPTEGVLLNVITANTNGMYLVPADDADCIVCEIDGPGQLKQVLWASEYVEVSVIAGDAQLKMKNGKFSLKNGAVDFKTMMDTHFNNLFAMTFTNGAGDTGPANNMADLESDKANFDNLFF